MGLRQPLAENADEPSQGGGSSARLGLTERVILATVPLATGIGYLWLAITLPDPTRHYPLEPRAFPLIIGACLIVVGLALTVGVVTRRFMVDRGGSESEITEWRDTWAALAAAAVFVFGMDFLGFIVAAVLVVLTLSMLLEPRKWIRNLITALIFAAACQYLFGDLLAVRLPAGLLGFML